MSTKDINDGSGAVGDPITSTMTAPMAEVYSIIGDSEVNIPMWEDTVAPETRLDLLRITLTNLRDALAQPGRFTNLMTWWHQQTIDVTLAKVATVTTPMQEELTHVKSVLDSYKIQTAEQTKRIATLDETIKEMRNTDTTFPGNKNFPPLTSL